MPPPFELSPAGFDLIKQHEGLRLSAYLCPANIVTIGYGHVILPKWDKDLFPRLNSTELARIINECQSRKRMTQEALVVLRISREQADALLVKDVRQTVLFLNSVSAIGLNQNQFDALVSFVFNVGQGNYSTSTLRKKIRAGAFEAAAEQINLWVFATQNGKKVKIDGLVKRRAAERALFEKL